ncbi:MAG: DNA polymerase III subunit alpha [Candidatus Cloacimonadales bacterium]|jgi:DNA polymerase-3 subunit alpha|nr:DNA polymerase III subunit alpha [Candidatus Cloacimonadales bacterium]
MAFIHLHNHTQYSVLDGACQTNKMVALAKEYGMPAVAMTDHGNMFGTVDFSTIATKEKIKPIFGIEAYLVNNDYTHPDSKADERYHLILLVKNSIGYKNLMKLSTYSYTQGFYYHPRISKSLLRQYSEGLICLSACIQGEIPRLLLRGQDAEAHKALEFYRDVFDDDFYLEIQDHEIEEEKIVMPKIISLAEATNTPLVATNDCHYLLKKHAPAHDVLLCIQMNKSLDDPNRMRYSPHLYFKTEEEMRKLFPMHQEAFDNTIEINEKIDFQLKYDKFLLPQCDIPKAFTSESDYLKDLCYKAVPSRYPKLTEEIKNRIDYELSVITSMGFASYFLVVKDFIDAARERDVPVGPGRGSAAGSIISYLLGITQLDPLKYGLIFERFLNPERISMPDIDIDFCAEGRSKVIDYVIEKYGRESVTQIITYGTLGAKSVIKDVARVMDVSAAESNRITKLMPSTPGITLTKCLKESSEFKDLMESNDLYKSILEYSLVIEGLIRQIGIHAAGVVIGPGDLSDYVPLAISNQKGGDPVVLVQYEGKWLDDLKLLKMDFLGLKNLTVIKHAVELIKKYKKVDVDIENIDLTDEKTYQLLSQGMTDGIFQFESDGMKKYLSELKPNQFEDLIAMVALYRPGPMQFIPKYIKRKHGEEKVSFDHPLMENTLKETYGVTVYQEQVMQLSRELAGFTGAQSDELRKAIGKKKLDVMEKMRTLFAEGARKNGLNNAVIETIWTDWVNFANYAFNKSHAACYAFVAYQTAYLKANYPVEYMAALLSLEESTDKIPQFIYVAKKMGINVLPPSVNYSDAGFSIRDNNILFGLQAIKNVGSAALSCIINERDENGPYKDIFELAERVDSQAVNKATLESLIYAGAMDELEGTREQQVMAIENAMSCAIETQINRKNGQVTLFDLLEPDEKATCEQKLPEAKAWSMIEKLEHEKSVLGFYLSGHPLSEDKYLIDLFTNTNSRVLWEEGSEISAQVQIIGIVSSVFKKRDRRGNPFAIVLFEDIYDKFELSLFADDYDKYISIIEECTKLYIVGVQNTYNSSENDKMLRLKPLQIYTLEDLCEKLSGEIVLQIDESYANSEHAKFLLQQAQASPGHFSLKIKVKTDKFNTIDLHPQKLHIFPNNQFYKHFRKKENVSIQIRMA